MAILLALVAVLGGCTRRHPAATMPPSSNSTGVSPAMDRWQGVSEPWVKPGTAGHNIFILTNTGGRGWYDESWLSSVAFCNARQGWVCGWGGVYRTADGGFTWHQIKKPGRWGQVAMASPRVIWLMELSHPGNSPARLWHSGDAGKSWHQELKGKIGDWRNLGDLYARGPVVWVVNSWPVALSYYSNDAGKVLQSTNFSRLLRPGWCVAIPEEQPHVGGYVVYAMGSSAAGFGPRLIRSLDGGKTWAIVPIPPHPAPQILPHALWFVSRQKGWIGCRAGKILFTRNGGKTWLRRDLPSRHLVVALWFDQLGRGFAAVQNGAVAAAVYETLNGGRTWRVVLAGHKQINALYGKSGHLWGVGSTGGNQPEDIVAIMKPGALSVGHSK